MAFNPELQHLAHLQKQEQELLRQVSLSAQVQAGLEHLQAEVDAIDARLTVFDQQVPREEQLDAFLRQIDQAAKQTEFAMTQIKPGRPQDEALYSRLPIAITASSPFPSFYRFLSAIYAMPRLAKIEALSIVRKQESDLCDISFTLSVFMANVTGES